MVVEIFSGEVIFTLKSTTYYGGVLDQLWHDAVTGRDLDQVLADAIASLQQPITSSSLPAGSYRVGCRILVERIGKLNTGLDAQLGEDRAQLSADGVDGHA